MKIDVSEKNITITEDNISISMNFIDIIDISKLDWYIDDLKEQLQIKKEQQRQNELLKTFSLDLSYDQKRRNEYPPIQEQLDMLYWDLMHGTDKWRDKITEIKTKHPKPTLK
jgi:cell shape-determining protein MreC